ncbi:unnamed protein product [Moneuplotes crassus]|uniref:Sulfite exporter TauE/SafE family protein n=1 Tax=Euplotes crassus TaxID=5936 RepID=A0AAD1Y8A6_EUPCR|nr:unnamed protein product [Moneuplotes crassus]
MRAVHRNLFILLLLVVLASSKTPDSDLCKTKEKEGDIDYYCDNSPIFVCKDYGKDKYCVHKGVFPAEWRELLGALILAVAISLCNAAGIGGGGIIVTINVTLFQFSAKESIAMSNFVIFFGCLTRYIRNFKNKHPLKDATAIDYGIVTCQMPLVMLGTFIGVQINEILPETLVFILLFVTLLYLTYKAFVKAIDAYKKEKKIAQEKKEQKDEERVPLRGKRYKEY